MKNSTLRRKAVVFFGMIATGKSYLAKQWAEKHNYLYLNTDVIRKDLFGIDPSQRCTNDIGKGLYTQEVSRRTYDELLRRGQQALEKHVYTGVVFDGSFHKHEERQKVIVRLSGECDIYFVYCYCPEALIRARLEERLKDPNAISDGNWEIYLQQKEKFDKPDDLSKEKLLRLDTDASLEYLIGRLNSFLDTSEGN